MSIKTAATCKCGGNLKTIETKRPPKHQAFVIIVQRRRECVKCGKRFATYEIRRTDWRNAQSCVEIMKMTRQIIKELAR